MQQMDSIKILSFIVNIKASPSVQEKKDKKNYPAGVPPMVVRIPWAAPPMIVDDYVKSCKVYSFDGKDWNDASSLCVIISKSDSKASLVTCNAFGTFGISCTPGTAKRDVVKKTNEFNFISMSFSLIAILAMLML